MRITDQFTQQYKNTSTNQRHYLSMALTLGLIIGLVVITYPAIQHILNLQKELTDGRKTLTKLEEKSQALTDAAVEYDEIKAELPVLDLALPAGTDLKSYFQKPIESLASQNKLGLAAMQFTEVPLSLPKTDVLLKAKTLPYTLTLTGNFTDFAKFLASIEKFIRVTEVTEINLSAKNAGQVSAELKLNAHYFGGDGTGAKTETTTGGRR